MIIQLQTSRRLVCSSSEGTCRKVSWPPGLRRLVRLARVSTVCWALARPTQPE